MVAQPHQFDPMAIDLKAFAEALKTIRAEADADCGQADVDHLIKMEMWGRLCTIVGYGTAWIAPNPISAALMSQGILSRWLMMHLISHRGYDRIEGIPAKYTSKVFAKGGRRLVDWMDWIYPEAWHEEHDFKHHYRLGEEEDPDLLERNADWLKDLPIPDWSKTALLGVLAGTWKWFYYAPSTMDILQQTRARRAKIDPPNPQEMLSPFNLRGLETWTKCLLPYAAYRYVAIPALFAPLGRRAVRNVLWNTVGAEFLTNLHSFMIVGPNHTGEDLYRFDGPITCPEEFYLRQVVGSANYALGDDVTDYLQMWLNYQIEHHIWPDMTMLQYRAVQPKVEALCAEFGIPYVKENVFTRVRKMLDVLGGKTRMQRVKDLGAGWLSPLSSLD